MDATGKKNGRGAYLCPDEACFKKAYKSKSLARALSSEIPETVFEALLAEIGRRDG